VSEKWDDSCSFEEKRQLVTALQKIRDDLDHIKEEIDRIELSIDRLVTKERFNPVEMLVYGMAASIFLGVLGAILSLVIQHGTK
jgi:hypothetical protein